MVDIKGLLSNPMAALQSSRQPGGLLAPVTSFREGITDPRLFLADALINRTPITTAIGNYAAVNKAFEPDKLSERETRLQDIMTELGVDRATAIKYDKGLITQGTTEAGKPALIDIAQNTITPLQNITSQLNDSASIGVQGEQEIENVIPQFIVSKPQISMELVTKGERDNATELATSSEIALSALNEMNTILARDPRLAGIVGMGVRFGKGAIESLSDIVGERNLKYLPEGFDAGLLTDPDVERLAILEDQFVAASADIRAKKGDRAPNIKDYTEERNRLNLTGFTGGKGAQQRINEIAREVNVKSMQYQSFRGGFQPNLYSDMVKDYSLDPNFNAAFGTSVNTQTGIVTKRFKASDVLK